MFVHKSLYAQYLDRERRYGSTRVLLSMIYTLTQLLLSTSTIDHMCVIFSGRVTKK